jgi:hypothetical protein
MTGSKPLESFKAIEKMLVVSAVTSCSETPLNKSSTTPVIQGSVHLEQVRRMLMTRYMHSQQLLPM